MEEDEEKKDKDEEEKTKYTWDQNKRQSNLEKHGYDFNDAEGVIENENTVQDYQERKGEERWLAYGELNKDVVVVVFEDKEQENEKRIISIWKADQEERDYYFEQQMERLGRETDLTKFLDQTREDRENIERQQQKRTLEEREEDSDINKPLYGEKDKKKADKDREDDERDR